jgi:hypothetical protein
VLVTALFAVTASPAFAVAPTVTSVVPNTGSTAGGTAIVITGTGFGTSGSPLVTAVTVGGTPATAFAVVDNTTLNVTTPAHAAGQVDIVVTTDAANTNTSADDFTYLTPPTITGVSPNSGSTAGGNTVTITGTGFTGVTQVNFGGTLTGAFNVGATSLDVLAPAHAVGTVDISITTANGTTANTTADDYTYTAAGPNITSISPTTGSIGGGTIVTINGTGFTGATGVSFGATPATTFTVNTDVKITATAPAHAAGTVHISVTTPAGTSPDTSADNFQYGTVLPVVTSISPTGGPVGGGNTVTVNGTGFTGATLVTFGGSAGTSVSVVNDTQLTVIAPPHLAGSVDVLVTTLSGTSANTAADNYLYGAAAPTITSVAPSSGPLSGGNTVTITGTGLTGATGVTFGGVAGTSINVASDTSLTVVAPTHAAGVVDIVVTTSIGSNANTAADNYTYSNAPFITDLSPASGPIGGGTIVTITGVGFTGATSVTFGGTAATTYTVNSSTQITATAPAHSAGTVNVVITGPDGSSPTDGTDDNYVYGSGPVITSISPTSGPVTGGTSVTITGTGFTGATAVMFGSVAATSFTVVSDTQITAVSPAQANSVVQVSVTTPIGTSADVAADNFTYGSGSTVTFTLYFRWTLLVWNGKQNADITTALKGQENPDNPATNDVSGIVTAIFHYNNPLQKFEGFFPGSAGVPGANDFTTFKQGEAYWIAISATGSTTWTTLAD